MTGSLNELVSMAAKRLQPAQADTEVEASEDVLTGLAAYLGLDVAFLRHNDHQIHATRLIAQWPIRTFIPDPDPIGVVSFEGADPVFAMAEHLREPLVIRPEPATDEYQHTIQQGTEIPAISMACVPLLSNNITTGTLGFVKYGDREWLDEELNALQTIATMFAQLQARIVAMRRLQYLAEHDDLTGLHNSRVLMEHLVSRLSGDEPDDSVAVLYVDLDRLKAVNDLFGHTAGDQMIAQVSARLSAAFAGSAFLARLGGDEFVIVPDGRRTIAEAHAIAQQMQSVLSDRFQIHQAMFRRSVSIGVAVGIGGRDSASDVLRYADQALLAAKSVGGNAIAEFNDDLALEYSLRNDVELHLRDGIESDALVLHYQPEVDLRTGAVVAVEALVRWNHPTRGLLMPDSFIPVAEYSNLAAALGRRVLRTACAQLQRWRSVGLAQDIKIRVNVSPVQLVTEGLGDHVNQALSDFGLAPSALCFDVTEHSLVGDAGTSRDALANLKDIGVSVAVDHFGTGYSVLGGLKSMPIDTLKIDKSFVRDLGRNSDDVAIVRSIAALADAFDLELVAEGLETLDAARLLMALGCYRAQGFLLSAPIDGAAMGRLLADPYIRLKP